MTTWMTLGLLGALAAMFAALAMWTAQDRGPADRPAAPAGSSARATHVL